MRKLASTLALIALFAGQTAFAVLGQAVLCLHPGDLAAHLEVGEEAACGERDDCAEAAGGSAFEAVQPCWDLVLAGEGSGELRPRELPQGVSTPLPACRVLSLPPPVPHPPAWRCAPSWCGVRSESPPDLGSRAACSVERLL